MNVPDAKRVAHLKHVFEDLMTEARAWSDRDLWHVAAGWFAKAARAAKNVSLALSSAESGERYETGEPSPYDVQLKNEDGQWCFYTRKAFFLDAQRSAIALRGDDRRITVRVVDGTGKVSWNG